MLTIRGDGSAFWRGIGQEPAGIDLQFIRATMITYLQWRVADNDILK